jgi:hypothetical protein
MNSRRCKTCVDDKKIELIESFDTKLTEQIKRSELVQEHTRTPLHLASQELFGFKQVMWLPVTVSDSVDEEDSAAPCSVESINVFLDDSNELVTTTENPLFETELLVERNQFLSG